MSTKDDDLTCAGVLYQTWKSLGILRPQRSNRPDLNVRDAAYAEVQRLMREVQTRRADARLPAPLAGQEYLLQLDGLYVCAVDPESLDHLKPELQRALLV